MKRSDRRWFIAIDMVAGGLVSIGLAHCMLGTETAPFTPFIGSGVGWMFARVWFRFMYPERAMTDA